MLTTHQPWLRYEICEQPQKKILGLHSSGYTVFNVQISKRNTCFLWLNEFPFYLTLHLNLGDIVLFIGHFLQTYAYKIAHTILTKQPSFSLTFLYVLLVKDRLIGLRPLSPSFFLQISCLLYERLTLRKSLKTVCMLKKITKHCHLKRDTLCIFVKEPTLLSMNRKKVREVQFTAQIIWKPLRSLISNITISTKPSHSPSK